MHNTRRLFGIAISVMLVCAVAAQPTHADAVDGARKTFQTDIPNFFTKDVPHFFQDDVPCAFGGQPTSGTKSSCPSKGSKTKPLSPIAPPPPGNKPAAPPPVSPQ